MLPRAVKRFFTLAFGLVLALGMGLVAAPVLADSPEPRTLVVAVEVSRDDARIVAFTAKERPYVAPPRGDFGLGAPYAAPGTFDLQTELRSSGQSLFEGRHRIGPLCLDHGRDHLDHVQGDTILRHSDIFLLELPELVGADRIELAYSRQEGGAPVRRVIGSDRFDAPRYDAAGGALAYADLVLAPSGGSSAVPAGSSVLWPEDFADSELYRVYGDPNAVAERINVVIVPDGYTYSQKATMEAHAQAMVDHFRNKTPYAEHDPFFNYILVYGYSSQSGTDQCDCGVVVDTAFGTRFPDAGNPCGHSGNRCLYYGGGCDGSGLTNIVAAELRAPAHDETIVMVNTTRYGGCGGARSVYSAGNSAATEIAVHELGHSLGGLADEYVSSSGCGSAAGEINTSIFADGSAWAEWKHDLGTPHEGAQYWSECVYRPEANCEMRALGQPFCAVCRQHWSLVTFGHPRVAPTAPVRDFTPPSTTTAFTQLPVDFTVQPRFSAGAFVTNTIRWTIEGPGFPEPTEVATGATTYQAVFAEAGIYTLRCEVVADTNFVKPERYGANRDEITWTVDVQTLVPPPEISAPGAADPLGFVDAGMLHWEEASGSGAASYNLYRGELGQLATGYGSCLLADIPTNEATSGADPAPASGWFYLVTASNPAGEGPLGFASSGAARPNTSPCP